MCSLRFSPKTSYFETLENIRTVFVLNNFYSVKEKGAKIFENSKRKRYPIFYPCYCAPRLKNLNNIGINAIIHIITFNFCLYKRELKVLYLLNNLIFDNFLRIIFYSILILFKFFQLLFFNPIKFLI